MKTGIGILILLLSAVGQAQETNGENLTSYDNSEHDQVNLHSTRFTFGIGSAHGTSATQDISYTSYNFELDQDLGRTITLQGRLPLIRGQVNGKDFSELGNVFLGGNIKLLELQEYHPLWFSVHGGVRFSRPENDVVAAAQYQEYHSGASLSKHFHGVTFLTDGNYIQKVSETVPGQDVGNELDAMASIQIDLDDDIAVQGGCLVRHADPLRQDGQVVVGEDLFTAVQAALIFHVNPGMDLSARLCIPTMPASMYSTSLAAFGDLSTQATIGRSWSLGIEVGI